MESPYKEILIFVFGGGMITAIIAVSKEIRERVAEKKKQKTVDEQQHLSNTVELQRLENESDEAAWKRLNSMLEKSEAENDRLCKELEKLQGSPSLSETTKTRWYKCYRELGAQIGKLEMLIIRQAKPDGLLTSLEDLKKKYDELGEKMP